MNNLIISLTSYPARIDVVYKTIESLLCQTVTSNKIVLWLAEEQFPNKENDLPKNLLELTKGTNFEIDWCEDIRSYKKLIPALRKYPDSTIITCDDDVIYDRECVEKLVKAHKRDSKSIWCHRGHYILFDKNKKVLPYRNWFRCINPQKPSFNILQTGIGAVLYPQGCFYKDVLDKNLFMDLAYDADDIWFWAMAVLNGYKVGVVKANCMTPVSIIENDENALWLKNLNNNENDRVIDKVFSHYPDLEHKLSKTRPWFIVYEHKGRKIFNICGIKIKVRITK